MATTYRIAVIGSWESVMGFRALGLVSRHREEAGTIREAGKSGDTASYPDGAAGKDLQTMLVGNRHGRHHRSPAGRLSRHQYEHSIQRAVGAGISQEAELTPPGIAIFSTPVWAAIAPVLPSGAKPVSRCCPHRPRSPSSKQSRFFRLWRRFGCFP